MLKISQLTLALLSAAALVACGGGSSDPVANPTPTPTPTPTGSVTLSTSLSTSTVNSAAGGTTVLTVTYANTKTTAVSGEQFLLGLPTGTASTSQFGAGSPCGSSGFTLGGNLFMLTGLTIPAGATCTNTITLKPTSPGTFIFSPSGMVAGLTAGSQATLTVQ